MTNSSKSYLHDNPTSGKEKDAQMSDEDRLANSGIGILISSSLYKLEHISDHHVRERRRSFRITNIFVGVVSALIFLIAVVNLYNIYYFYDETMSIINTTHDLNNTVIDIAANMNQITGSMLNINHHMASMEGVYVDVASMSDIMPLIQNNIADVGQDVAYFNRNMSAISGNMNVIDHHLKSMSGNVMHIEHNIQQIAEPMGKFNSILP
ncbi:MAG: hypothetical protein KZQ83_18710 [gamma proteobacterium symbiont of Taylorina sp.]|nr:hypothetical protein [gamma proteobacterium symbiont of Taylorina sp.]